MKKLKYFYDWLLKSITIIIIVLSISATSPQQSTFYFSCLVGALGIKQFLVVGGEKYNDYENSLIFYFFFFWDSMKFGQFFFSIRCLLCEIILCSVRKMQNKKILEY